MSLPVTAIYAAICGFMMVGLAAHVVRHRVGHQVSLGDADKKTLRRAVRAHGNAAEYIPIALILIALLEANGASAVSLHVYGLLLVVGRLLHAYGLLYGAKTVNKARQLGIILSWLVMLATSVHLLL